MIRNIFLAASVPLCIGTAAIPCGFHGFTPMPSVLEQMLASEHIVLARAAPDNPFRFAAIEAIEGSVDHVDIPFLVDSVTRRKLSESPQASVLFAREGAYGPWQRLAFVDSTMRPVVDQIVERLPDWEMSDDERFTFFADLLNHPSRIVHNLALKELDQAEYPQLKAAVSSVDVLRIAPQLNVITEANLRPIRVLLLGLSGDASVSSRLEDGLAAFVGSEGQLLGAYATAFLELGGSDAAETVTRRFLTNPELAQASAELLIEAMALNAATGDPQMRAAIHDSMKTALVRNPALGPAVARQFGSRNDWSYATELSEVQKNGAVSSALDAIALSQYILLAAEAEQSASTE